MKKFIFLVSILIGFFIISCKSDVPIIKTSPTKYTVTFVSDTGTVISSQEIEEGDILNKPEDPIKKDYDFIGWFIGKSQFDFSKPIASNITLKAKWNKKSFTVIFDSNGGNKIASQKIEIHKTVQKPDDPVKDNYDFLGWFLGDSLFDFSTPITSNISLKAKWEKKTSPSTPQQQTILFTVTFDSDGGNSILSQEVENTATKPIDPVRDGYDFFGWFLGDSLFDFSTPITSNIILKAKWNKKIFTVLFDSDEGTFVNNQSIEYGENAIKPNNPTKTGYSFIGWYNEENLFDFSTSITTKITLTAKWSPINYTIVFDKTSGSGQDMQEITVLYDEEKELPHNTYNPPVGMKFAGWAKDNESSNIVYNNKQIIKNLANENNSIITLYAVWIEKDAHSIIYHNMYFNGETIDNTENPSVYYESQNIDLKALERKGYVFEGWFLNSNFSEESKITGWKAGDKTDDVYLYPKWTLITYNITYEGLKGVTNPNPTTYTVLDKWVIKSLSKNGYSFKGWKIENKNITYINEADLGDITLTAQWELLQYDIYYFLDVYTLWKSQIYDIEHDVLLDQTISNSGYSFAGWYENIDFSGSALSGWSKGEKIGDIYLNAKWEPKTISVSFDSCEGSSVKSQVITYNSITTQPEDPVYNDYTFMGWYFDPEQTIICNFSKPFIFPKSFEDTESVTLYAKWGKFVYVEGATVAYDTENNRISQLLADGEEIPLSWNHTGKRIIYNLYVSDHEIIQSEYTKYCSYSGKNNNERPNQDSYKPVTFVTWNDAIVYCNLRSIAENLTPAYSLDGKTNPADWTGIGGDAESKYCGSSGDYGWRNIICDRSANGYRLPTYYEWEYIARDGSDLSHYEYSGSDNIDNVAWYKENSSDYVHYGKCKIPNALGIYDMSGNVAEWCWETGDEKDPYNPPYTLYYAYIKGGDYTDITDTDRPFLKTRYISTIQRQTRLERIGFRIVRTVTE